MKTVSMSGSRREDVGKKDAKKLRNEGKVPCVLYGGSEQVKFWIDNDAFKNLIFTPEVYLIDLSIDGKKFQASLQDVQYHPLTDNILHVDFLEVNPDKPITIGVPVKISGNAQGVLKGGKMVQKLRKLKVKGLAKHLPDHIAIDISELDIMQSTKVQDIKIDNLHFLDNPSSIIVTIQTTRGVADEQPGAPAK
jgi:large subunit ribosomal protein L25